MSHGRGLQAANAVSDRSKGRSRGPPGEVSDLTLVQKGTWLASEVSLPRKVPDPSQFLSDSEPQGEEFEDAQSYQNSPNPKAGSAVTEGAYEPGWHPRQAEFDDRESLIPQVPVSSVQERIDAQDVSVEAKTVGGDRVSQLQRRKSYDPNSLGRQGSMTGTREVRQGSSRAVFAFDGRRTASVESDTTGVINRSSGTDSRRPSEARDDEE
ncbi:hypothetical protein OUZ56_018697 [Daphnia magna]|uniref:Uncharacterized protein n=1 Tax=Daphnia magna TaxID=35525 RepID=A0ABQ9Z9J5_9CRUS|nr:hypothetical protein OUZ56_018697 [Daphnia magna]